MADLKPFVQIACICERVLLEKDDVASAVRIVDTITLTPETLPDGVTPVVELTAFICLKSGPVIGNYDVGLVLRYPSGKRGPVRKWPVVLNGQEHGANLRMKFMLNKPEIGLYWFDVLWSDEPLTSIPFRLQRAEPTKLPEPKTN